MGLGKGGKVESEADGVWGVMQREWGPVPGSQTLLGLLGARGQEMTCRKESVRTGTGPHAIGDVSEVMQRSGPLEKARGEARRLGCCHTLRPTMRVIPHS